MTSDSILPEIADWQIIHCGAGAVPDESWRLVWEDEGGTFAIFAHNGVAVHPTYLLWYDEIASFALSYAEHAIRISTLEDEVPNHTIGHLLVDQVWPRILAHRGELVLHAAGVSSDAGALLFIGQSGRGKSTLAASLHQRGLTLLGDDAVVISMADGQAHCRAVYRSLRLFPDSIDSLFDRTVRRSEVADYTDKENIHLPAHQADRPESLVRAIFFIGPDGDDAPASVAAVSPADACMRLVEHSFWLDPTDKALTARKLGLAGALADGVPAYQLAYPRDYAKIDELHAAIFSVLD